MNIVNGPRSQLLLAVVKKHTHMVTQYKYLFIRTSSYSR
ncbi:hypothetical protein DAI22_12g109800 [Oryza sativa Japonica Group]|nr:hypothetical protein DAI22_12g109800 [Oryza sativa Japonica Group]